jgi:hypothetical protein
MQGKKASSWRFIIETRQLRETTLTQNIGPGVGRGSDNPTLEKTLVAKSEEAITERKLAEVSEESQGPRRAVEPMMIMILVGKSMVSILLRRHRRRYEGNI